MKKLVFIIVIFYICFVHTSCRMGYICSGYDLSDKSLIPFRFNDTIIYVSNMNDTLILLVTDFYASQGYERKGFYTTYECISSAYYFTNENNGISIKENDNSRDVIVTFCNDKKYDLIWQSLTIDNDYHIEFDKDVVMWKVTDLSGQRRINKFIKVANRGITEFYDHHTSLIWRQINND